MTHPYSTLPDYSFWYKAVTHPFSGLVDPVTKNYSISPEEKVATMGSCFAQHLSNMITNAGFCYYVSETAPSGMSLTEAKFNNYGTFSARYGNVYTARQALQLFDRAYGLYDTESHIWMKDEAYIDGFRPHVQPNGFATIDTLLKDRFFHLESVRDVFQNSDWLIFTLGLTEAWQSISDGVIFPVAPGVFGGSFDPTEHKFVNFSVNEVVTDMIELINKIKSVNKDIKFIFTVSPVPLVATYENRHVLVSTCLSKSVLRVAAAEIESLHQDVTYFPSYEIITSPSSFGRYYEDDLRQVTSVGVNHVMRIFSKHFMNHCNQNSTNMAPHNAMLTESEDIVCDEELITKAIRDSGF